MDEEAAGAGLPLASDGGAEGEMLGLAALRSDADD
jgi:hypothetical protein